jgi:hypothetical protein
MRRVMGVRNDEELVNLRKIGIVGVRHRENYSRIKADEWYAVTGSEHVALVWNPM